MGIYWSGGQGLTRYIIDNCSNFDDKKVLDIGAGCGASSLAFLKFCENVDVTVNDIDLDALDSSRINLERVGWNERNKVRFSGEDFLKEGCDKILGYDVLLVGDLLYDELVSELLLKKLEICDCEKQIVLVGDPGRVYIDVIEKRLELLGKYDLDESYRCTQGLTQANVYRF